MLFSGLRRWTKGHGPRSYHQNTVMDGHKRNIPCVARHKPIYNSPESARLRIPQFVPLVLFSLPLTCSFYKLRFLQVSRVG